VTGHDPQDGTADYDDGHPDWVRARRAERARVSRIEHTATRVALARIDRERRRLAQEEEWILSRPEEPLPGDDGDGPVVFFRKTFGNAKIPDGRGYQYVAVYVAGMQRWYVSGKNSPRDGMRWLDLVEWAARDEPGLPTLWLATEWSAVNEQGPQD
jgi:hypothetical protein